MCHFIISNDVYTDCLLWEKAPEEASASKPDGNTIDPSHLARFLRILQNKSNADGEVVTGAAGPVDGASAGVSVEDKLAVHVIKQKTYFQCTEARRNPDLFDKHADKRYCPEAEGTKMVDKKPEEEFSSKVGQGKPCPVCVAAQNVIKEQLFRIEVKPAPEKSVPDISTPGVAAGHAERDRLAPPPRRHNYEDPPGIRRHGRHRNEEIPRISTRVETDRRERDRKRRSKQRTK